MRARLVQWVESAASRDSKIVFLTGDLGYRILEPLQTTLGGRFLNLGVAEANLISVAAGLGSSGMKPFLYSACPFVTLRCLEQIRNDLAFQKISARIVGTGAGFTYGAQGPSHHALEDMQVVSAIPRVRIVNPGNAEELEYSLNRLEEVEEVVYFRLGKDRGARIERVKLGPAYRITEGKDVNLIVSGHVLGEAVEACQILREKNVLVNLISCPWVHPFPNEVVSSLLVPAPVVSLVEAYPGNPLENSMMRILLEKPSHQGFLALHVQPQFAPLAGSCDYLRRQAGIDSVSIAGRIEKFLFS